MKTPQEIADLIVHLSKERGVSVNKLAIESGAGRSIVDNLKKGQEPRASNLKRVADYLGVTTDYLLTGKQQKNNQPTLRLVENPKEDIYMDKKIISEEAKSYLDKLWPMFALMSMLVDEVGVKGVRLYNKAKDGSVQEVETKEPDMMAELRRMSRTGDPKPEWTSWMEGEYDVVPTLEHLRCALGVLKMDWIEARPHGNVGSIFNLDEVNCYHMVSAVNSYKACLEEEAESMSINSKLDELAKAIAAMREENKARDERLAESEAKNNARFTRIEEELKANDMLGDINEAG